MSSDITGAVNHENLRRRALGHLTGPNGARDKLDSAAALKVLHDLASSPSTAAAALTLLHELQVHQVELDMQHEELRRSRGELEVALARQLQLYDFAPVGCFTVDQRTTLGELNLTAARMLGSEREYLLGRTLESFLVPESARALREMLTRVSDGAQRGVGTLELAAARGVARKVHASANRDSDGQHFLVVLMDVADPAGGA
jgi:PAS domain S-box-containing protein